MWNSSVWGVWERGSSNVGGARPHGECDCQAIDAGGGDRDSRHQDEAGGDGSDQESGCRSLCLASCTDQNGHQVVRESGGLCVVLWNGLSPIDCSTIAARQLMPTLKSTINRIPVDIDAKISIQTEHGPLPTPNAAIIADTTRASPPSIVNMTPLAPLGIVTVSRGITGNPAVVCPPFLDLWADAADTGVSAVSQTSTGMNRPSCDISSAPVRGGSRSRRLQRPGAPDTAVRLRGSLYQDWCLSDVIATSRPGNRDWEPRVTGLNFCET